MPQRAQHRTVNYSVKGERRQDILEWKGQGEKGERNHETLRLLSLLAVCLNQDFSLDR